jgi:putative phage-type endonuclease
MSEIVWTEIEQGSDPWHDWRTLGMPGSYAPVVMDVSPWKDRQELFDEITGVKEKPEFPAFLKKKGDMAEERCSAFLKEHYDLDMIPICCEQTELNSWKRVSLDGADLRENYEDNVIAEYKFANKKDHGDVCRGIVPEKYWPQVQWQLHVTQAHTCYYVSYWEAADDYACVLVKPDLEYQEELVSRMAEFWDQVKTNTKPDAPLRENQGNEAWCAQAQKVVEANEKLVLAKAEYNKAYDGLKAMTKNVTTVGNGVRLTRTKGKTTIDWDQVKEIKKTKDSLTEDEIKKITKVGKPSWKLTYLKEK